MSVCFGMRFASTIDLKCFVNQYPPQFCTGSIKKTLIKKSYNLFFQTAVAKAT
jgi:hypothetical protein